MLKPLLPKEEWEGLPDAVKEHYVEEDGAMHLGVTPTDGLELMNPVQIKKALQTERASAAKAEKARKALEAKLGDLDVDAAREAIVKLEEMAGMDPEGKAKAEREVFEKTLTAKYEADRKKLVGKHESDAAETAKSIQVLESQLQQQMIAAVATKALSEAGGAPELLLPHVEKVTRMRKESDGSFKVVVLDVEGVERLSPVALSSNLMTITELVAEMHEDKRFARGFDGSGASGSGAGRSGSSNSGATAHKITRADAKDVSKYRAAKAAADKAGRKLEMVD